MSQEHLKEFEPFWQEWYIEEEVETGSFCDILKVKKEGADGADIYKALKVIEIPKIQVTASSNNLGERRQALHGYFGELAKVVEEEIRALHVLNGKPNILSYDSYEVLERKELVGYDILMLMPMHRSYISYISGRYLEDNGEIIQMAKDICRALLEIHNMDFLHRDLKLENIYIDEDGNHYLGEIGLENKVSTFQTGSVKRGSYEYLAPEVYLNKEYSKRADIYSLGVILYILCNDGKIPKELQRRDKNMELPMPCNAKEKLSELIFKSMAYDPKERYDSAESMLKDLEKLTEEDILFPVEKIEEIRNALLSQQKEEEEFTTDDVDENSEAIEETLTEREENESDVTEEINAENHVQEENISRSENNFGDAEELVSGNNFGNTGNRVSDYNLEDTENFVSENNLENFVLEDNFENTGNFVSENNLENTKNFVSENNCYNEEEVVSGSNLTSTEGFVPENNFENTSRVMSDDSSYDTTNEVISGSGLDITERIIFGNHCFGITEDTMLIDIPAYLVEGTEDKKVEDITSNIGDVAITKEESNIIKEKEDGFIEENLATDSEKSSVQSFEERFADLEENIAAPSVSTESLEDVISSYRLESPADDERINSFAAEKKNNNTYSYSNINSAEILQNVEQQYYDKFATKTMGSTVNLAMQAAQVEREQEQQTQETAPDEGDYFGQEHEGNEQMVILRPATPKLEEGEVILKPASENYNKSQITSFVIPMDSQKDTKEYTEVKKQGDFWKNTPAVGTYVDDMQEPIEIPLKSVPKKKKKTGMVLAILVVLILAAIVVKILYSNGTIDNIINSKEKTADITKEKIVLFVNTADDIEEIGE